MASGTLQEDGVYVVHTKEVATPQPDLTSACSRAEVAAQEQAKVKPIEES